MWSATKARIQPWLTKHQQTLQHRPAAQMFPLGLALGGSVAAVALLGLGQLPGLLVCALLLGATIPLLRGAEPVTRQRPAPPMRTHRAGSLPEVSPMPSPATAPHMVVDIPGLLDIVELPGGTFWMGSAEDDEQADDNEKPRHAVTVSGFAIGRVVVTRRLYREVMAESPAAWERDRDDDLLPANHVRWFDAVAFCNRLSERQGLTSCYQIEGEQVRWEQNANGYRLPTEAEWEYAARADTTTRWFCGDEPTELERYAWFDEDLSTGHPHPVGQKEPNPWSLYDMAGNVWEWCWDGYGPYTAEAVHNPIGTDTSAFRVLRGGAYLVGARVLRSAFRGWVVPGNRLDAIGFRVVRRPRRQPLSH
jgi:formylglycine-generating enzyme required for sulfatase activity